MDDVDELHKKDARLLQTVHDAVERFVTMRSAEPAGGKPIGGLRPRGLVKSLRVGPGRAVTSWDEAEGVCWLLAYHSFHQNGHPEDCYEIFLGLHADDELLPSTDDYDVFFETSGEAEEDDYHGLASLALLERLEELGQELLEEARAKPGVEAMRTLRWNGGTQMVCVDAVVEIDGRAEDGWMSVVLPPDEYVSLDDVYDLLAAILPADVIPIYVGEYKNRPRAPGEIVYRWELYEES